MINELMKSGRSLSSEGRMKNRYIVGYVLFYIVSSFISPNSSFSDSQLQTPGIPGNSSTQPSIELPSIPPTAPSAPTATSPDTLSLETIISQGREAYRSGDFRRAYDLLEEALLDAGTARLPPDVIVELASSSRRIGHTGRAIALLLPLLHPQTQSSLMPHMARSIHYEIAMADKDRGNIEGAVHQLIPIFHDLSRSRKIRHATGILLDYWRRQDPVSGVILMGQSLHRLNPPDQKIVMTRTIDLIFSSVRDKPGLLKILAAFPRDFPGDYAAYRLALLDDRSHHPGKAEKVLLRMILYFPESLYVAEAEHLLNRLSMDGRTPSVGLVIPDLTQGPLRPYMRSILTGAVLGFGALSPNSPTLIVRVETGHDTYTHWYADLLDHEHVSALIGPFMQKDLEKVRLRLIKDQILAVTPTLPIDSRIRFLLSMASLPPMVAAAIAHFSLSLVPKARAVVLYPTDFYGRTFRTAYEHALTASGGNITASIPLENRIGKRQEAVLKLRKFGQDVSISPKGPLPEGVTGRFGDFVTLEGRSYYLVYPPHSTSMAPLNPFFFRPDFDVIVFPNDSLHPFKVLDELVYKNIQNVDIVANESLMMARRQWDMVSDIHNPLYSVAPVNLFHTALGRSSKPVLEEAYAQLISVSGRSPVLLELESYDCAAFLSGLLKEGFRTRYHLGAKAISLKEYNGLSGRISWTQEGMMSRDYTLFRFSGGDWKPMSTQSINYKAGHPLN